MTPGNSNWKRGGWILLKTGLLVCGLVSVSHAQIGYRLTTDTPVDLVFDDVSDFENGISGVTKSFRIQTLLTLITDQTLLVAAASNLTSGAVQIPASTVRVTSMGSGWTDHTAFLDVSTPQPVTSEITLSILLGSRTYTLRYDVPSTPALFNKPDGVYSTQLTYSFTGLLGNTASATLNLRIQNVLQITASGNSEFAFDQEDEFSNGLILTQTGGLIVSATRNYDIHVQASGPFSSGSRTIPVSHLSIAVLNAGGSIAGNIPVSTAGSQLVNEGIAALQKPLNLRYELEGGPHLLNLPTAAYTTTLTYTISAD